MLVNQDSFIEYKVNYGIISRVVGELHDHKNNFDTLLHKDVGQLSVEYSAFLHEMYSQLTLWFGLEAAYILIPFPLFIYFPFILL